MGAKAISKVLGWTRTRDSASGLGRAIEGSLLIDARTCCKGCKYAFRIMTEMKFKPLCYANSTVICRWAGTLTSVSFRQVSGSKSTQLALNAANVRVDIPGTSRAGFRRRSSLHLHCRIHRSSLVH